MGGGVKVPVIERPNRYTVYYEGLPYPNGLMTFVHCDILGKWSKSMKVQLEADFRNLIELRHEPLFCLRHNHQQQKFITMFGFEFDYSLPKQSVDVYKLEFN